MFYAKKNRALTAFGSVANQILEARPEFEHIDPKRVWGEDKPRNWNAIDQAELFLVTLMKHLGWKPPSRAVAPSSEGLWRGYISSVNLDELQLFAKWAVEQEVSLATMNGETFIPVAATELTSAKWGSW